METELSGLDILFRLLAVLVLVGANGFFVASEFSLVSVRRTRIEELVREGKPLARAVKQALADLDAYLAATQLGITMASIGLGWIGEPALAALLEPVFAWLPSTWQVISAHAMAVVIAFAIITSVSWPPSRWRYSARRRLPWRSPSRRGGSSCCSSRSSCS
jgi:CBS domain containing-hemolysin-like protein